MPEIKDYRKRPLVVGALHYTGTEEDREALRKAGVEVSVDDSLWGPVTSILNPGSGELRPLKVGDYVILAPTGCRYPVQADQFERNYEPVEAAP